MIIDLPAHDVPRSFLEAIEFDMGRLAPPDRCARSDRWRARTATRSWAVWPQSF